MTNIYLGVDIGGTNIKLATMSAGGRLLRSVMIETRTGDGPDAAFRRIGAAVEGLLGRGHRLAGAGVGCAGIVDARRGRVLSSPNLPAWRNTGIRALATRYLKVPTVVDNDANVGVWGEYKAGAGKGYDDLMGIFVGTGIGGGLIFNGEMYHGPMMTAGEIGHVVIRADAPRGQRTLENLQPKQAKDTLLRILEDEGKDPEDDVLADVVAIVRSMPQEKLKKILGEFKTEAERTTLHRIMLEIGEIEDGQRAEPKS